MKNSEHIIRKALQLSLEGDRLLHESRKEKDTLKDLLRRKAIWFYDRANTLYDQSVEA